MVSGENGDVGMGMWGWGHTAHDAAEPPVPALLRMRDQTAKQELSGARMGAQPGWPS